jgi:uncharacterized protein (TIGR02117 family)
MKFLALIVLLLGLIAACSAPIMKSGLALDGENVNRVFVLHDNWHAALVFRKADLPVGTVPEQEHFPDAEYLELSWGDQDYFPAAEESIALAFRAAFWSHGSVLHVVGFRGNVKEHSAGGEIIEIELSRDAFLRLTEFVSSSFSRPDRWSPAAPRPGLVAHSRFYPASGRFSILRTCNTWVAEALKSAGLDISPGTVITAASLARQLRRYSARE